MVSDVFICEQYRYTWMCYLFKTKKKWRPSCVVQYLWIDVSVFLGKAICNWKTIVERNLTMSIRCATNNKRRHSNTQMIPKQQKIIVTLFSFVFSISRCWGATISIYLSIYLSNQFSRYLVTYLFCVHFYSSIFSNLFISILTYLSIYLSAIG